MMGYGGSSNQSVNQGHAESIYAQPQPSIINNQPQTASAAYPHYAQAESEAQAQSSTNPNAQQNKLSFGYFCGSLIILLIWFCVAFTMSLLGLIHWYHCPIEDNLPMWLLVQGVVWLVSISYSLPLLLARLMQCCNTATLNTLQAMVLLCNSMIALFSFLWLIYGVIMIYTMDHPEYDSVLGGANYCHYTVYTFTWWYIVLMALFCLLSPLLLCCLVPVICCYLANKQTDSKPTVTHSNQHTSNMHAADWLHQSQYVNDTSDIVLSHTNNGLVSHDNHQPQPAPCIKHEHSEQNTAIGRSTTNASLVTIEDLYSRISKCTSV